MLLHETGHLSCRTHAAGRLHHISTVNMHTTSCSRHTMLECRTLLHWRSYWAQLYLNIMEISPVKEIHRRFVCVSPNSSIMVVKLSLNLFRNEIYLYFIHYKTSFYTSQKYILYNIKLQFTAHREHRSCELERVSLLCV